MTWLTITGIFLLGGLFGILFMGLLVAASNRPPTGTGEE